MINRVCGDALSGTLLEERDLLDRSPSDSTPGEVASREWAHRPATRVPFGPMSVGQSVAVWPWKTFRARKSRPSWRLACPLNR
jgi:hypothetical protein